MLIYNLKNNKHDTATPDPVLWRVTVTQNPQESDQQAFRFHLALFSFPTQGTFQKRLLMVLFTVEWDSEFYGFTLKTGPEFSELCCLLLLHKAMEGVNSETVFAIMSQHSNKAEFYRINLCCENMFS